MPTFVVLNSLGQSMKVDPSQGVLWVQTNPNKYPSKYAAKRHLKELDILSDSVKVVPLLTEEGF